jgi:catechol 2,3-dioxygenase-like lactoylglutathione lyase family enzyme
MGDNKTLPQIGHVGYIVRNLEESVQQFKTFCGIEDFIIYYFTPKRAWVNGEEIFDCRFKIGLSNNPCLPKIELIEPISGEKTPHFFFIREKGQNIHHIAYYVDDYEYWHRYYENLPGAKIVFEAEIDDEIQGKRSSFYAVSDKLAGMIEISKKTRLVT